MSSLKKNVAKIAILLNQMKATRTQTLLKVTTCLYRGPNIRARSLSTLIEVSVIKDNKRKIPPVAKKIS